MAPPLTRRRLGALILLVGAFLLTTALFLPWFTVETTGILGPGINAYQTSTQLYLGLPSWMGTVQYCSPYFGCSSAASYASESMGSTGLVAETVLFLVGGASALGLIAGSLGLAARPNPKRGASAVALALAALVLGVVAPEVYAGADILGLDGPQSSFWGYGAETNTGGYWISSWGPSAGWYLSIIASGILLTGVVLWVTPRETAGSVPSSARSEPVPASAAEGQTARPLPPPGSSLSPLRASKGSRRALWVVVTVVVIAVVVVAGALAGIAASWVKVPDQGWTIDYAGQPPSYAPSYLGTPTWSPSSTVTGWTGGRFTVELTVTSSDYLGFHNITAVAVASPFTVASVAPSLPVLVRPGETVTITVTVTMPPSGGSYALSGTITAI